MNIIPQSLPQAERPHLDTMIAGALLPFTQATITAFVIGIGTYAIAWLVFDSMDPHKPAILLFVLTWVVMMFILQRHWLARTTGIIERIIERDINGDGVIGEKVEVEQKPRRVTIDLAQISAGGSYQSNRIAFPGTPQQLETFAQGCVNGMPVTDRTWSGDGKLYTGQEWREMKAVLFKFGLLEYVNEQNKKLGIRLTDVGRETLKQLLPSPPPEE